MAIQSSFKMTVIKIYQGDQIKKRDKKSLELATVITDIYIYIYTNANNP